VQAFAEIWMEVDLAGAVAWRSPQVGASIPQTPTGHLDISSRGRRTSRRADAENNEAWRLSWPPNHPSVWFLTEVRFALDFLAPAWPRY
jgi:hypothetical protein